MEFIKVDDPEKSDLLKLHILYLENHSKLSYGVKEAYEKYLINLNNPLVTAIKTPLDKSE